MAELPHHPDLDHLRREARELLRAATNGEPAALARLRAVSPRLTLSTAQLAVAHHYGFASWPALRTEVAHRRQDPPQRWSLGGAAAIRTAAGLLTPGMLVVGSDQAIMDAQLFGTVESLQLPGFDDLAVTDDRGTPYTLRCTGVSGSGLDPRRSSIQLSLAPIPPRGCGWLELRNQDGATTRLLPAAHPAVRITTPATPPPEPPEPTEIYADGPRRQLDIGVDLPRIEDTTVRLDSIDSAPESWCVYLRAAPGWWVYSADGRLKWAAVAVRAQDDVGGSYVSDFGGGNGHDGHEAVTVRFRPRMDPRAGTVTLTFSGADTHVAVHVDVTP